MGAEHGSTLRASRTFAAYATRPCLLPLLTGFIALLMLTRYGYGWAMAARGWLYDRGILASEAFSVPVIVLGNLRVGGTGKSPHAAYVVEALLSAGHRVALLSRGYGRQTTGFRLVTAAATAVTVGDEPLEQARRFAAEIAADALTIAVSEDRRVGIRVLLARPSPPAVVVLDDAFQHRAVRASLRLLLTELARPFTADRILPLGRLREFASGATRASALLITKCPPLATRAQAARGVNLPAIRKKAGEGVAVFFTAYEYGAWRPLLSEAREPFAYVPVERTVVALTAIDNPAPLYDQLLGTGHELAKRFAFADHHVFTSAELTAVADAARAHQASVLTTGKDAARLLTDAGAVRPELTGIPVWWVPVRVRELPGEAPVEGLRAMVLRHVRDWKGGEQG